MGSCLALVVPKAYVKTVKNCLEKHHLNHQGIKIKRASSYDQGDEHFVVPTSLPAPASDTGDNLEGPECASQAVILDTLRPDISPDLLSKLIFRIEESDVRHDRHPARGNFFKTAALRAFETLESRFPKLQLPAATELMASAPHSYIIYPPLLLLPKNTFESESWKRLWDSLAESQGAAELFFATLACETQVTHIAMDAPVPFRSSSALLVQEGNLIENIRRTPHNLKPLYGEFGAVGDSNSKEAPTSSDFAKALWVSTRQNGIYQTWAPIHTMFSSGNVTEKARILQMGSVRDAVRRGQVDGLGCSAVDLFAGIGYFAFSYARSGISKIICWDLNPWSVQGLVRGSHANGWPAYLHDEQTANADVEIKTACNDETIFIIFCESNIHAQNRVAELRSFLPPIRHVNCGALPSMENTLRTAVDAIDPDLGGWIHFHESALQKDVLRRTHEIMVNVQSHLDMKDVKGGTHAQLQHVEKVKSMGPRLWHIVLDIWIPPVCVSEPLEL